MNTQEKNSIIDPIDPDVKFSFVSELEKRCNDKKRSLGPKLDELIVDNPGLLGVKFEHKGYGEVTAAEFLCCHEPSASSRDLLYELISRGSKATLKCYQESIEYYNFIECLLLSGYMPIYVPGQGGKFLDCMMEDHSYLKDDSETIEDILRLLLRLARPGDQYSFGEISEYNIERLKQLPELKAGVTHKKGGEFDDILRGYLESNA